MKIKIYVNRETRVIETSGHSKNEVCSRVTTLMDIIMRLLDTEEVQRRGGYTMIAYKDKKHNHDLIDTLFIPYINELEHLYSRQLNVINEPYSMSHGTQKQQYNTLNLKEIN